MPQPIPPAVVPQPPQRISPVLQQQQTRVPPSPLPLDRKVITPPSTRTRIGGATTPQQLHNSNLPSNTNNHMNGNYAMGVSTTTMSNSTNVTPNKPMIMNFHSSLPATTTIAPIGVRPPNFLNGGMATKSAIGNSSAGMSQMHHRQSPSMLSTQNHFHQSMMSQSQHPNSYIPSQHLQQQQYLQHSAAAVLKSTLHNNNSTYNQWSGWGEQVNNIEDLLNPRRSFGPLGSNFGDSSSAAPGSQRNNLGNIGSGVNNESNGAFFP